MAERASDLKACALCGVELPSERFQIAEEWTAAEVEAQNMRTAILERADTDANGNYIFYFCQWRHMGLFESECCSESATLKEKEG